MRSVCPPTSRATSICGEAIIIAVGDMDVINAVTKILYPEVAKRFGTTASRVDARHPPRH